MFAGVFRKGSQSEGEIRGRPPSQCAHKGGDDEKDEKHEKQNLCDFRGRTGYSGEAENPCDQSNNKESEDPTEHVSLFITEKFGYDKA